MNIRLTYDTKYDAALLSAGLPVRLIRLYADVKLKTPTGWAMTYQAIIDTGSSVSVVPRSIWTQAEVKPLLTTRTHLLGIGSGSVSGRLAEVILQFIDEASTSSPTCIKAHMLDDDSVPFIIGFEDALAHIDLFSGYRDQRAYLDVSPS